MSTKNQARVGSKHIRIFLEDIDKDKSPEVFIEYYNGEEFDFSITVSSSGKNGVYDKVNGSGDADGDGDIDEQDKKIYKTIAQAAFNQLK
ncbi:hypothetical protein [Pseudomonas entomophila]|uniref:hypothetical protein n=1 Tax=Pseudomonas entomophila TaxID=312306 RepID=UPI003EBE5C77